MLRKIKNVVIKIFCFLWVSSVYTKADSFYGIWCGASKTEAEAQKQVNAVKESGFDARMFVTTDWSNLNSEKCT